MLKALLLKLGNNPHKSWADFKIGLVVFAVGAGLILSGLKVWVWLQIPGLILLTIGFLFSAKGYVGIFANRFSQTLNRLGSAGKSNKSDNHLD